MIFSVVLWLKATVSASPSAGHFFAYCVQLFHHRGPRATSSAVWRFYWSSEEHTADGGCRKREFLLLLAAPHYVEEMPSPPRRPRAPDDFFEQDAYYTSEGRRVRTLTSARVSAIAVEERQDRVGLQVQSRSGQPWQNTKNRNPRGRERSRRQGGDTETPPSHEAHHRAGSHHDRGGSRGSLGWPAWRPIRSVVNSSRVSYVRF